MVINKKFRFSVSWRTVALEISFLRRKKKREKKRELRPTFPQISLITGISNACTTWET